MLTLEELKYPIGKFKKPDAINPEDINKWITVLEQLPLKMREAVNGLNTDKLDTPYREGGWTIRQVVHHVADSHINAYIRFKLALTEDNPTIKPYLEASWAELPDAKFGTIEVSLRLLEAVHARLVVSLRNISTESWKRTFFHPEKQATMQLDHNLALYAWHSEHHLAHIVNLRKREKW
ncbi:bacillithiol transferase BstA [soil metagenome]